MADTEKTLEDVDLQKSAKIVVLLMLSIVAYAAVAKILLEAGVVSEETLNAISPAVAPIIVGLWYVISEYRDQ